MKVKDPPSTVEKDGGSRGAGSTIVASNLAAGRDIVIQVIKDRYGRVLAVAVAASVVFFAISAWRKKEELHLAVERDTRNMVKLAATDPQRLADPTRLTADIQAVAQQEDKVAVANALVESLNDADVRREPLVQTAVVKAMGSLCRVARRDRVCPALLAIADLPGPSSANSRRRYPREVHDQALQTLQGSACRRCPGLGPHICRYLRVLTQSTLEQVVIGTVIGTRPEEALAQRVLQSLEPFSCP